MNERLCFLAHFQRIDPEAPRLNRIGFIRDKDKEIRRLFDHISLSFVLSGDGILEMNGRTVELKAPFLLTHLPGEKKRCRPLTVWTEFFVVYQADMFEKLVRAVGSSSPRTAICSSCGSGMRCSC